MSAVLARGSVNVAVLSCKEALAGGSKQVRRMVADLIHTDDLRVALYYWLEA